MSASPVLSSQFKGFGASRSHDPHKKHITHSRKPKASAKSLTMKVESSGLPKAPDKHPHRMHAAPIPRRAR
jgi:hypothetical protein